MLYESERFIAKIENTNITLEEWQKQRLIFKSASKPSFELGFATFFLSRTNRSGILGAGPIGGQNPETQRNAKYKLDCRFNKFFLIEKIKSIVEYKKQISVTNHDALHYLNSINNNNTFVYLDPPYYYQGKALYLNYYTHQNHVDLSNFLKNTVKFKWMLSYDNVEEIRKLYSDFNLYKFNLCYTAQDVKKGSELLTHSNDILFPRTLSIKRVSKNIKINRIKQLTL